jgi:hypothetical protein
MTPEQQMLCLAALTYRDFADAGPPLTHDVRFRHDVESKLKGLAPNLGRWKLVWGPASYRAPASLFDDAAMFVVQNADRPNQYVVAVRGTNPISAMYCSTSAVPSVRISWKCGMPSRSRRTWNVAESLAMVSKCSAIFAVCRLTASKSSDGR